VILLDISLISRSFEFHKQGIGSYSKMLYESIKTEKDFNIRLVSQDDSFFQKDSPYDYLFFDIFEIPIKLKESDVYHALTPLESFYLNSKKSVVSVLDLIPIKLVEMGYTSLQSKITKIIFEKAIKKAIKSQEIIAISEETANDLNSYFGVDLDEIHVVRTSIQQKFVPLNKKHDTYTIGTVSHLNNRKRINILIKSFLEANIENSRLLIGGKGPELDNLKKLSKNDSRIEFLGFIPDDKMNEFYNSIDIFVFPTIIEGYGLPIVEAMACGKQVITLKDALIPKDIKNKTHISSNLAEDLKEMDFRCDINSNLKFADEHSPENMKNKMVKIYRNFH
jgi:glycosyltransferase involved in cell wall biosynthesis